MKRVVLTNLGGMPFEQEDLKWLQDATKEELAVIANSFRKSGTVLVLSGCVATPDGGGDVNVSGGWLMINDELVYWTASTIPDSGGTFQIPAFEVDTDYDAAGNEEYEDGNTHDTYQRTFANVGHTAGSYTQAQYMAYFNDLPRLQNYFEDKIMQAWQTPTVHASASTPSAAFSPSGNTPVKYRKTGWNRIELTGDFSFPSASGSGLVLFTLPVGYRPDARRYFKMLLAGLTTAQDDANNFYSKLEIRTNGDVMINAHATDILQYCLHGISFELQVL